MLGRQPTRRTVSFLLTSVLLALPFGPALQVASAQCADPRGNTYCSNNGQVTFNPPPGSSQPASQPCADPSGNTYCTPDGLVQGGQNPMPGQVTFNLPPRSGVQTTTTGQPQVAPQGPPVGPSSAVVGQGNGAVSVDPAAAPAGATVTVSISGMPPNSGFVVNLGQLKTNTGLTLGAKSMQTADQSALQSGRDGSFSGTFTVPAVPDSTAPEASICASILGRVSYCTPFTLQSAGQPPVNDATPQSIVGHYQCSSELFVGRGSQWCEGTESLLVLNDGGTYSVGDESGTYTFDPGSFAIAFSGPLGSGSILNRKLQTDSTVNGVEVRYTFIRMNY
jgi:hypothetical protein